MCATEMNLHAMFPQLQDLPLHTPNVTFVTSQELEDKYPCLLYTSLAEPVAVAEAEGQAAEVRAEAEFAADAEMETL